MKTIASYILAFIAILFAVALVYEFTCSAVEASYYPRTYRGQMALDTVTIVDYAATGTYEKIIGDWGDSCLNFFTLDDVNDRLIYQGPDGVCFLLNGTSEIAVSSPSEVWYALYINGALVEAAQTKHSFASPAITETISITKILTLNNGDYLEVWTKSSVENTLTISSLSVTVWGER